MDKKPPNPGVKSGGSNVGGTSSSGVTKSPFANPSTSNMGGNSSAGKPPVNPFAKNSASNVGSSSSSAGGANGDNARKPAGFGGYGAGGGSVLTTEKGLEIMGLNASLNTYEKMVEQAKGPGTGQEAKAPVAMGANNYQAAFEQQKALEKATLEKTNKAATDLAEKENGQKMRDEQLRSSNSNARARELQNQITFWKGQAGQGQYSDDVVNGTLQQLTTELNGIPSANR